MRYCPRCSTAYDQADRFCPTDGAPLRRGSEGRVGELIAGQLRLTSVAGQGATGTVYRAWQEGMEREVAVKILHRELAADDEMVHRFAREARAVARLSHPNIVTVFTVGATEDGAPFLAMELVGGGSLEQALAGGAMEPDRAVAIARQIVSALAETHAEGIVHRDLKPANVLLTQRRRAADLVKILDFGVAKILADVTPEQGRLTQEGAVFGTPAYIAPEQASGDPVDHRADLYSVGIILYRMLTGRLPFEGEGLAVMLAHLDREPTAPVELAPALDPALSDLVMRCLAKEPDRRFASAEELADALDGIARPGRRAPWATATAPLPPLPLPVRTPGRRPALALLGGLLLGLVGAGGWTHLRADAVAAAPGASAPAERAPGGAPAGPPALRAVVVAEDGYSMRVVVPKRMVTGMDYELRLEVWDPGGEPLIAPELVVTVRGPDGVVRGLVAQPTPEPGRYRIRRSFPEAGRHVVRVFPPTGDTTIQVFFEVADGRGRA